MDKIPYDKEPIYRQQTSYTPRPQKSNSKGGITLVSIIACVLVVLNLALCGFVLKLVKDNKSTPQSTNIFNIDASGVIDATYVADKTMPSAVRVHAVSVSGSVVDYTAFSYADRVGSGVIISGDKQTGDYYILTCNHVVQDYHNSIYVLLPGSFVPEKAQLATTGSISIVYDIAVLKVSGSEEYKKGIAKPCEVGDSSLLREGDMTLAYGNQLGAGLSVSTGVISQTNAVTKVGSYYSRALKTTSAINKGNSGGGLFNSKGELIGIVNAKNTHVEVDNIAYAIPSNVAVALANNMLKYKNPIKAMPGFELAISSAGTTYDIVDGKLYPNQHIVVSAVESGKAAEYAGFKVGDEIVSFSYKGKEIAMRNVYSLEDEIFNIDKGDTISFKVIRNGKLLETTLDLKVTTVVAADEKDWFRPKV